MSNTTPNYDYEAVFAECDRKLQEWRDVQMDGRLDYAHEIGFEYGFQLGYEYALQTTEKPRPE